MVTLLKMGYLGGKNDQMKEENILMITFEKFEKKIVLCHGILFQNSAEMMKKFRPKVFIIAALCFETKFHDKGQKFLFKCHDYLQNSFVLDTPFKPQKYPIFSTITIDM